MWDRPKVNVHELMKLIVCGFSDLSFSAWTNQLDPIDLLLKNLPAEGSSRGLAEVLAVCSGLRSYLVWHRMDLWGMIVVS